MAKNLLKAAAPKKKRTITPRGLDAKYFGEEPTWDDLQWLSESELESRLGKAYNWYNYFYEPKDGRKYLLDYMNEQSFSKSAQSMLSRTSDSKLNSTMCNTARMFSMGLMHSTLRDRLDSYIAKLVEEGVEIARKEKASAAAIANLPEITHNPAGALIADIEDMLDNETSFDDFYKWLKGKNVKPAQAKAIADYYTPWAEELEEAQKTKDADLKYAYRHLSKKELTERIATMRGIISDCESLVSNNRKSVVRKPRKTKPKSADKIVSKLKFQKESNELKIVSIDPSKIVGAKELWTFNTKYNVLAHYWSEHGLGVKGTTLQGVDNGRSRQKKLRKPTDVLPSITGSTSKAAERAFEALKTKEATPNGRINEFTIILRAIK
jgi:hypothetical protein